MRLASGFVTELYGHAADDHGGRLSAVRLGVDRDVEDREDGGDDGGPERRIGPVVHGPRAELRAVEAETVVQRVKFPPNYRVAPHTHPYAEVVTVVSGTARTRPMEPIRVRITSRA